MISFDNINTSVKTGSRAIHHTGQESCHENYFAESLVLHTHAKKSLIKKISLNSQPIHCVIVSGTEPTASASQEQRISHPGKLVHNHPLPFRGFHTENTQIKTLNIYCHCRGK